jgi:hypothetical protein
MRRVEAPLSQARVLIIIGFWGTMLVQVATLLLLQLE